MNCKTCKSLLNDFFDRNEKPDATTLAHIEECGSCRQFYKHLHAVQLCLTKSRGSDYTTASKKVKKSVLKEIRNLGTTRQEISRLYFRRTAVAAGLCGILVLANLLVRLEQGQPPSSQMTNATPIWNTFDTYPEEFLASMVEAPLEQEIKSLKKHSLVAANYPLECFSEILSQFDEDAQAKLK